MTVAGMQRLLVGGLFVITPLIFYQGIEEAFLTAKLICAETLLFLFMIVAIVRHGCERDWQSITCPVSWLLVMMLAGYTLSSFMASPIILPFDLGTLPSLLFGSDYFHFSFFVMAFFFLVAWRRDEAEDMRILFIAVIITSATAIYGLMQFADLDPLKSLWVEETVTMQRGIFSTLGNANMLSVYCGALLPLALLMFLGENELFRKSVWGLVIVLFATTVLVTGTRGVWLACFFVLILLSIVLLRRGTFSMRRLLVSLSIILVIVLIVSFVLTIMIVFSNHEREQLFWNRMMSLFDPDDVSGRARLIAWDVTLRMIADQPLTGIGIGEFKRHFLYYRAAFFKTKDRVDFVPIVAALNYTRTHNEYLQAMSEGGLFVVLPLLGLLVLLFIGGARLMGQCGDRQIMLYGGCWGGMVVMAIDAIFSFPFHLAAHAALFIYFASIIAPSLRLGSRSDVIVRPVWARRDYLLSLPVLLAILLSLSAHANRGITRPFAGAFAEVQTRQARKAIEKSPPHLEQALVYARNGLDIDPTCGPLWFYRAQAYQMMAQLALRKREHDEASQLFKKSINDCRQGIQYRTDAAIFVLWGVNKLETGEVKRAWHILKLAADLDPSQFQYLKLAGIAAFRAEQYEEALAYLQYARDLDDEDLTVHHLMAALRQRQGDDLEALIHLNALWNKKDLLPKYRISPIDIALNFADTHRRLHNYDVALYICDEMAKYPLRDERLAALREKILEEAGL